MLPIGVVVAASGVGVECLVPVGVVVVSSGVEVLMLLKKFQIRMEEELRLFVKNVVDI